MKRLITLLLLTAITTVAVAQTQMVRLTRFEGKNITGVNASTGFDVELYLSDKTYATVEVNADLEDKLIFAIDDKGVVSVGFQSNTRLNFSKKDTKPMAKIYLNKLDCIKASSGADVKCMGAFECESAVITASSGADIENLNLSAKYNVMIDCNSAGEVKEATINAETLRCELSSSGEASVVFNGESSIINTSSASKLNISGASDNATIDASSASSVAGIGYNIKSVKLRASSTAKIVVGEIEELSAHGSSASSIRYKGTPKVISVETSSASSIKKIEQ